MACRDLGSHADYPHRVAYLVEKAAGSPFFPLLDELMLSAATQNLDLHLAMIRMLQARVEANGKKGDLYPHLDGSLNAGHVQYSKDALVAGPLATALPLESRRHHRQFNFFEAGFDADWEIDFFGKTAHKWPRLGPAKRPHRKTWAPSG